MLVLLGTRYIEKGNRREIIEVKGWTCFEPPGPPTGLVAQTLLLEP
jgi:hypothetical protein